LDKHVSVTISDKDLEVGKSPLEDGALHYVYRVPQYTLINTPSSVNFENPDNINLIRGFWNPITCKVEC